MLVLTRKKSEAIRIGNDVFVKVIRTGRSTVKIGIEAPASVRVVRGELVITQTNEKNGPSAVVADSDTDEETVEAACSDQFPQTHIVHTTGV
jgi:carbon storage regulator CsrA